MSTTDGTVGWVPPARRVGPTARVAATLTLLATVLLTAALATAVGTRSTVAEDAELAAFAADVRSRVSGSVEVAESAMSVLEGHIVANRGRTAGVHEVLRVSAVAAARACRCAPAASGADSPRRPAAGPA